MSISSGIQAKQSQTDPSVGGIEPPIDDTLSNLQNEPEKNGVGSENGTGTGSAGIGDQSFDESEKQSSSDNEDSPSKKR